MMFAIVTNFVLGFPTYHHDGVRSWFTALHFDDGSLLKASA
jgi:hypothetical protein